MAIQIVFVYMEQYGMMKLNLVLACVKVVVTIGILMMNKMAVLIIVLIELGIYKLAN